MKKNFLILALLFFVVTNSFSQSLDNNPKNVLKVSFPAIFAGSINLAFERAINKKVSIQVTGGYRHIQDQFGFTFPDNDNTRDDSKLYTGFTVVPEIKYYLTNQTWASPRGFYVSAFGRYGEYEVEFMDKTTVNNDYNAKYTFTEAGGGILAGFQFVYGKHLVLDAFLGPQFKTRTVGETTFENRRIISNINAAKDYIRVEKAGQRPGIRLGFNIGIAF